MNSAVHDEVSAQEEAYYDILRPLVSTYSRTPHIRSVAVVGNQPLAPSAQRAAVIDAADLVFRVNGFRLDEDEPTVGRRADVVVFNRGVRPTPWFFQDYTRRLYLMIEPGRMHEENPKIPDFWPRDLGIVTLANREVIVPLNRVIGQQSAVDGLWATTGTTMLWTATRLFPNATVDVAGLSFVDAPEQRTWSHAFGDPSAVGPEHLIANEGRLVRDWISSGRIRFHR
ncbi:hypothetical protein [Microbacterium lacus]|uniref:Uncharacterized protein n=1 Tax=Microbacterium lacus TaxID=415217 RepID=A0ABN2GAU9_9MICO